MKVDSGEIAVVGMAGKFPDADNVSDFWRNLCDAKESIRTLNDEELKASGVADNDLIHPDYVKRCSLLDGVSEFDPGFFKIPPVEAELMDPQLRLLLQCAWETMEDAGYATAAPQNVGVFAGSGGMTTNYYSNLVNRCNEFEKTLASPTHLGNDKDFLATYISYKLNLTGPSFTVQTACSTSMVAVHQACLSLLAEECEMALAGGVRIAVPHAQGYCYREGYIFSKSGHVKSFDAGADGVVFGSGLGLVLLKKLDRAISDRDQIHAVIKATSISNDGRDKLSYAASSARGQIRCIKNALDRSGVDASTIGFVEAHGTGTLMGDPEEVKALSASFKSHTEKKNYCALGSVKTNIGHLDAAAGIASLIKAVLTVRDGTVPPTLNFDEPNPRIRFDRTAFFVNSKVRDFPSSEGPRRAGVNSLGVGGTNAFVIIEEFKPPLREPTDPQTAIVPISARNDAQLKASCKRLLDFLCRAGEIRAEACLADVAYTLQVGRASMKHRVAFVVDSLEELCSGLEGFLEDSQVESNAIHAWSGDCRLSNPLDSGNDTDALVRGFVEQKNWPELASGWVSGMTVDWSSLYGPNKPHRIGLPSYPFAREKYWLEPASGLETGADLPRNSIHPLLHTNTSTFEAQSYITDLADEACPIPSGTIRDDQTRFIPVLAYAEMLHAAMQDAMGSQSSSLTMTELHWPSPLATEDSQSVAIALEPLDHREVNIEVSTTGSGKGTVLCQGRVTVGESTKRNPVDLRALRNRLDEADTGIVGEGRTGMDASVCKRALECLHLGPEEFLVRIGLPESLAEQADTFCFHPALVAGLLEVCIAVSYSDGRPIGELPRAVSLGSLTVFSRCESSMHLWVRRSKTVPKRTDDGSTFSTVDVDLLDDQGNVCARIENLVLADCKELQRPDDRSALASVSVAAADQARPWDGLSFLSDWEEDSEPPGFLETRRETVLVVCPPSAFGFEVTLKNHYQTEDDCQVILVRLSDETEQVGEREWNCSVADSNGFSRCLHAVDQVDALFFLAFDEAHKPRAAQDLTDSQERYEIQLLRLVKVLKRDGKLGNEIDTYLLTADQFAANSATSNCTGGGVPGIGYSLAQGNYQFLVRNIDIDSTDLAQCEAHQGVLDLILCEAASNRGEPLKITHGRKYRQAFHRLHWEARPQQAFRQGGVYVILGGAGTVGQIFTRYLTDKYSATVAWIGRSDPESEKIKIALSEFTGSEKVAYFQADVTLPESIDKAIDRIHTTYSRISGGFFSGQVIDYESSIDQTTEEAFRTILQVKSSGSWNFYKSLEKVRPDFICYFSSGQTYSFSGAAKLSSYASAITFADRLVQSIQQEAPFPVGIINWGFWRSTVKSITGSTKGVSADSIAGLDDQEGFECCERFLNELQCGRLRQVLCMRVPEQIQPLMSRGENEEFTLLSTNDPNPVLLDEERINIPEEQIARLRKSQQDSELDAWLIRRLFEKLTRLFAGIVEEGPIDVGELMRRAGLLDKHESFVRVCLDVLHEKSHIRLAGGAVQRWGVSVPDMPEATWQRRKAEFLGNPDHAAMTELVDDCLNRLPEILRGEVLATDVIFPNASMHKVEGVYKHNILSDTFNELLVSSVVAYVRQRLKIDPAARIRILEIGAGTGGTSAVLFEKLQPFSGSIDEYCYTDLSKAFLFHAEEHYVPHNPYIRCMRLDISRPLRPQGLDVGTYDVVLSTNCLHATDNIRRTLANAKAALRREGMLIINEISRLTLYNHLTFGLLDGWWLFEDPELRIPGCPGLYPEMWQQVLQEEGFHSFVFPGSDAHVLGQQVVAAHSNGLIRQYEGARANKQLPVEAAPQSSRSAPSATEAGEATSAAHSPDKVRQFVEQQIVGCLSKTLKIGADSVDTHMAFSDYGLDSILGVGFVDQVNKALSINLNTAIIFDFPSAERLSGHVLSSREEQIRSLMSLNEVSPSISGSEASPTVTAEQGIAVSRFVQFQQEPQMQEAADSHVDEIAVIGMSGMFPKADNVEAFWRNLIDGVDGVQELPGDYLDQQFYSSSREQGKTRCKWGGVLARRDAFDPLFFNLSPREAESMNPHQRLILQEGWNAIEDAGYNPKSLAGSATGVFIGAEPTGYFGETFTGYSDAIVASRLSYYLDLRGPAFVVNTGCSSSGVALHLACESLRNRETNLAVAGGVNACMSQTVHLSLSEIEMLSPSGRCSTFDASGDGTVIGEGVGVVILKRLNEAVMDNDPIHGVICASGTNQDGASNGITAPNGSAQEDLVTTIYERFKIDPDRISYLEAHGTGTKLGDPIESNALVRAFRKQTSSSSFCAIGSAKSHIGHTAAAAGVIGLIKILLSLKHEKIPRLLHFNKINPLIEFDDSPFYVNTINTEWSSSDKAPRMAALNSFGHSGTNAHLVIRELAPDDKQVAASCDFEPGMELAFPLSARTEDQLRSRAVDLLEFLCSRSTAGSSALLSGELQSVAYTLQVGREAMDKRLGIVAGTVDDLIARLEGYLSGHDQVDGVFRGELVRGSDEMLLLAQDEDMQEAIGKWVARRKFSKLMRLWVKGLTVNWRDFYRAGVPRRLNLPTYPFAGERYWVQNHQSLHGAPTIAASPTLHPLVQQNVSDFSSQRYRSEFGGQEFFLRDHVVNRQSMLPAVAYLEMARAAVSLALSSSEDVAGLELHNVVWASPILHQEGQEILIDLACCDDGSIEFQVLTEKTGTAVQTDEAEVHCQGLATLEGSFDSRKLDIETLREGIEGRSFGATELYPLFSAMGIDFGPAHQGIVSLLVGPDQAMAEIHLSDDISGTLDDYGLHPSIMDSALQASIGLIVDLTQIPDTPSLPFALESLRVNSPCKKEMIAWVRRAAEGQRGGKLVKIDIDLCDRMGNVCVELKGFSARVFDRESVPKTSDSPGVGRNRNDSGSFDEAFFEELISQFMSDQLSVDDAVELSE